MDKLQINGGKRLNGDIAVSDAKNAALPILCAGLLTSGDLELSNVPRLHDVRTILKLLAQTGLKVTQDDERVTLNGANITSLEAPYELVKTMRASILVLGPLLARFGQAKVSLPGGCAIGSRPVDQHIKGLRQMGAEITACFAPCSDATPWITRRSVPMPSIFAPIATRRLARSVTSGSRAAFSSTVSPSARVAAIRRFSVPVTVIMSVWMRAPLSLPLLRAWM